MYCALILMHVDNRPIQHIRHVFLKIIIIICPAGVERQFEPQGRTALRLAHFLSDFLQNVDEYEEFGDLKGDRRLNETQIFAEVIANIMGDSRSVWPRLEPSSDRPIVCRQCGDPHSFVSV